MVAKTVRKVRRRAIFLDRDGTLIHDVGYLNNPQQVRLFPGVGEALNELSQSGFLIVLVSNQSGIDGGLLTRKQAEDVHQRLVSILAGRGVHLDAVYYCLHAPEKLCNCRKPSPGMLSQASQELRIDLTSSFMVGDKHSDIEAGIRAGCRTILIRADALDRQCNLKPDYVAASWAALLEYVLTHPEVTT